MTTRPAGGIVGALAVALVLSMLAPVIGGVVLVLAVPVAVAGDYVAQPPPPPELPGAAPQRPSGCWSGARPDW
jgi:hypothetical protein